MNEADHAAPAVPDPRRWITLSIVTMSVFIVTLDSTVLNVAIPTILRDFNTTLPSLQWVVTGYSLTFATLLIIGGRLGDIYGHRRVFVIGAWLFFAGSLLASVSWSVPSLVLGEALIEGIGASLMMPATLAIISTTFHGRERATAFAVWGAVIGLAAALGPVIGGFLTTNFSWRWSFRINLVIAPLAAIGALLYMSKGIRAKHRARIDLLGATLVAVGMFLLVFAISEGGTYGWLAPLKSFAIVGWNAWPSSRAVSIMPIVFVAAAVILTAFYFVERTKERRQEDPLFEFGQLRHRGFRYGLITTSILAMGQLGLLFALPVFLQDGKHLSAETNGLWLVPLGICIVLGSQFGGRLTRRIGTTRVVQLGLAVETVGLVMVALSISPDLTFLELLPGLVLFGVGLGFASSQLTNVILSDVDPDKSGVASGTNSTVRQVGAALGIAIIGTILTAQTIRHTLANVAASDLPTTLKVRSGILVHQYGANFAPPRGTSPRDAATLQHALVDGVAAGTRPAMLFAAGVVLVGTFLSLLIPRIGPPAPTVDHDKALEVLRTFDAFEAVEPDRAMVMETRPDVSS